MNVSDQNMKSQIPDKYFQERIPLCSIHPVPQTALKMKVKLEQKTSHPSIPNKSIKIDNFDVVGRSTINLSFPNPANAISSETSQSMKLKPSSQNLPNPFDKRSQVLQNATISRTSQKAGFSRRFFDQLIRVIKTKFYTINFDIDSTSFEKNPDLTLTDLLHQFSQIYQPQFNLSSQITYDTLKAFLLEIGFTHRNLSREYFTAHSKLSTNPTNQKKPHPFTKPKKVISIKDFLSEFKIHCNLQPTEEESLRQINLNIDYWSTNKTQICSFISSIPRIDEIITSPEIPEDIIGRYHQCIGDRNECLGEKILIAKFLKHNLFATSFTNFQARFSEELEKYIEKKMSRIQLFEAFILTFIRYIASTQHSTQISYSSMADFLQQQQYPKPHANELLIVLSRIQKAYALSQLQSSDMFVSVSDISKFCTLYRNRQTLKQSILNQFLTEMNKSIIEQTAIASATSATTTKSPQNSSLKRKHNLSSSNYSQKRTLNENHLALLFTQQLIDDIDNDIANLLSKTIQISQLLTTNYELEQIPDAMHDILREPVSFSCNPLEFFHRILNSPQKLYSNQTEDDSKLLPEDPFEHSQSHNMTNNNEIGEDGDGSAIDKIMAMHEEQTQRVQDMIEFWGKTTHREIPSAQQMVDNIRSRSKNASLVPRLLIENIELNKQSSDPFFTESNKQVQIKINSSRSSPNSYGIIPVSGGGQLISGGAAGAPLSGQNQNAAAGGGGGLLGFPSASSTSIRFDLGLGSGRTSRNITIHNNTQPGSVLPSQQNISEYQQDRSSFHRSASRKASKSSMYLESARNILLERQQSARHQLMQKTELTIKAGIQKSQQVVEDSQPAPLKDLDDSFLKQMEKQIEDMQSNLQEQDQIPVQVEDLENMYYIKTNQMYLDLCTIINRIKQEFTIV